MGLFNVVEYEADCIRCGVQLGEFQTKSGQDYPFDCSTIQPHECINFYTSCTACGWWNEFEVRPTAVEIVCVSAPRVDPTGDEE